MKLEDIDIQSLANEMRIVLANALCMDNHRNTPVVQPSN